MQRRDKHLNSTVGIALQTRHLLPSLNSSRTTNLQVFAWFLPIADDNNKSIRIYLPQQVSYKY